MFLNTIYPASTCSKTRILLRVLFLTGLLLSSAGYAVALGCPDLIPVARVIKLQKRLEDEGFTKSWLQKVFVGARLCDTRRAVRFNILHPQPDSYYSQFTEAYSLRLARKFLRKQRRQLEAAATLYQVPAETTTAILLVETAFGRTPRPYYALSVFASLAVINPRIDTASYWQDFRRQHPELKRPWLRSRLKKKSRFGYEQLVALLKLNRDTPGAVRRIRSSYAGALGIPQFIPTSQLQWAVDGNQDGVIDLDQIQDAISSVARYLNKHGWKSNANSEQKWKAVWAYNHSADYVETVLEISRLLKNRRGK